MSDRVAFARLDHDNDLAELRRELGVVTDERDTALAGWDKASAAWADVLQREQRGDNAHFYDMEKLTAERDALSAVIDKVRALCEQHRVYIEENDPSSLLAVFFRGILAALAAGLAAPVDHAHDVPPHTHGGTDAPECTTCGAAAAPVGETPDEPPWVPPPWCEHGLMHAHELRPNTWTWDFCPGPALPVE